MKKVRIIALMLCALMLMTFCFAGCSSTTKDEGTDTSVTDNEDATYKVGVIQYVSHPSLDNCYDGVEAGLIEAFGDNVTIDRQIGSDASADSDCANYAATMVSNKYDMIVAIATPAAIPAYAATEGTEIPVIFCAVSDPVSAELVESNDNPGGLCSGTSDVLDLEAQVDLIQSMQPDVKSIGVLYTTSEANSITQLENLKEICDIRGITVEASGVQNSADIPSAATALCAKVDCVNNFTDNNVVNNLTVLLEAAANAGIPVYGSEVEQVKNGCLAAVSIDYIALGKVTGAMAADVLNGSDITTMAVKTISDATPVVNTDVLEALSMTMPKAYADAQTVTTNS